MNKKGFTLVELLAVIAILAILVIIALPNVLKMFNDSKKNSFITETKTIYSEVSKKYISETMKGNKLTYISSEDDTKLEMTGRDLQYCVLLNTDGSVKSMKVSNGEWIAELPSGKKITDLNSSDLKDVPSGYKFECNGSTTQTPLPAKSFDKDSWEVIASNAKNCVDNPDSCPYSVGNEREVKLKKYGTHKVRIANMSTPNECNDSKFSQSACGFVVEFTDIITTHIMNPAATNIGGWPGSDMYKFLNDNSLNGESGEELSIINSLPPELKNVIIDTKTVSGSGKENEDPEYFTSKTDKLYLLAPKEIYSDWSNQYDKAKDKTRQLDYYKIKGVTTNRKDWNGAIKKDSAGTAKNWWLRSAYSYNYKSFYYIYGSGDWNGYDANYANGVSPAFRLE